jgi:pimeloyl-ACP methyl ester carboxylesterase
MPAVLIHGVPDTFRVWDLVIGHLSRKDVLPLALPGFGSPPPVGFTATKEEYVNWIIRQLEQIGQPVDLVGHDWGCAFTMRVVTLRPDLIRSWAAGGAPVSRDWPWHPIAKIWQTPGEGERWMQDETPADFEKLLEEFELPVERAKDVVSHIDELSDVLNRSRRKFHVEVDVRLPRRPAIIGRGGERARHHGWRSDGRLGLLGPRACIRQRADRKHRAHGRRACRWGRCESGDAAALAPGLRHRHSGLATVRGVAQAQPPELASRAARPGMRHVGGARAVR